ncbi:MAG: carboxymuconolactone decarboxylase family protein [Methylobacterium sp.]|uniref:carboxymuconolactone decarboxylase family protein n=1 Tax=Rhabdaerophilum sp. TaxID=2717341 RepID=UPI0022CA1206|nr:carboxymuconolactone decarboxylase family protein [Methylobacterium sp.]MCZ8270654.1 carboxymuconolactone decarboxylase family protein [Beijerinckiaceae bacterium]
MKNYPDITRDISAGLRELRKDVPDALAGFSQLTKEAMKDGALDKKTKEFIAMALGVAARCDACLGFHAEALVKLGATRQELAEVLAVAVQMGGGPSLMYAADAMTAFLQFEAQKAA